jgi:predicted nucleic acid-binding protein
MQIYLDTNVFIAAVEGDEAEIRSAIWRLFAAGASKGAPLVTSEPSIAELLVKPLQLELSALVAIYSDLLSNGDGFEMVPVSRDVLIRAAHTRKGDKAIKLPDAIHLATADHSGCSVFLTEDRQIVSKRQTLCRSLSIDSLDALAREIA